MFNKKSKNILCTVSSGYSSVLMASKMRDWYPDYNIVFAMANTSKERIESLEFMNKCDKYFNLKLKWIEAIFNESGKGVSYRIVNFKDLKRNGEIYEQGIKKLGIPCKINKWCNRDLKLNPLKKFADLTFGKNNYSVAVGLRADEIDRVLSSYKENNTFYPLIEHNITSKDRNKFWSNHPIKLNISAYKGNCDLCFEKSERKLMTIIKEEPSIIEWWQKMIDKYSKIEISGKPSYNAYARNGGMNFLRENKSIKDLVEQAKRPFRSATDEYIYTKDLLDFEGDCGAGCQVF